MPIAEMIPTTELCRRTGATFRQVDYWSRTGILVDIGWTGRGTGSGSYRRYDAAVVDRVRAMVAVSHAFVSKRSPSPFLRAIATDTGPWVIERDGIRITVEVME